MYHASGAGGFLHLTAPLAGEGSGVDKECQPQFGGSKPVTQASLSLMSSAHLTPM